MKVAVGAALVFALWVPAASAVTTATSDVDGIATVTGGIGDDQITLSVLPPTPPETSQILRVEDPAGVTTDACVQMSQLIVHCNVGGTADVFGGVGNDIIDFSYAPGAQRIELLALIGGHGNDDIRGSEMSDAEINGGPGDDLIDGRGGADFIDCGEGTDTVVPDALDIVNAGCEFGGDVIPPEAPAPTATNPTSPANDNTPAVSGTAAADVVAVKLFSDSGCANSLATGNRAQFTGAGIEITVADDTTTRVYANGTDQAGNASACASAFVTYVEDSTPPETIIFDGPSGSIVSRRPSFMFVSSDANSGFTCWVDGRPFVACTSPYQLTTLIPGAHTFQVAAADAAGNTDPSPATRTFTVVPSGSRGSSAVGGAGPGATGSAKPSVRGAASGTARVSAAGRFTLKKHVIECPAGGSSCKVTTVVKRKRARLGGSSYTLAAGKRAGVRIKLTKKGLRLLRRAKRITATATITVAKGAQVAAKQVRVTLRAAKRK